MIDFMWQVLLNIVHKYKPKLIVRMFSSYLWRNIKVMGHLQKNPISPTISYPDLGCRDPSGLPKLSLSRTSPNSPAWERRMDSLVIHGPRWWLNQAIWKLFVKLGIFPKFPGDNAKLFETTRVFHVFSLGHLPKLKWEIQFVSWMRIRCRGM